MVNKLKDNIEHGKKLTTKGDLLLMNEIKELKKQMGTEATSINMNFKYVTNKLDTFDNNFQSINDTLKTILNKLTS